MIEYLLYINNFNNRDTIIMKKYLLFFLLLLTITNILSVNAMFEVGTSTPPAFNIEQLPHDLQAFISTFVIAANPALELALKDLSSFACTNKRRAQAMRSQHYKLAIMKAILKKHPMTVQKLENLAAYLGITNEPWFTHQLALAKKLLLIISNLNGPDKTFDIKEIEHLIDPNVNINIQDNYGNTLLMTAASLGYLEICTFLIDNHAHLNVQNKLGHTALMLACSNLHPNHADIIKLLLSKKAIINERFLRTQKELLEVILSGDLT